MGSETLFDLTPAIQDAAQRCEERLRDAAPKIEMGVWRCVRLGTAGTWMA